jgi:hypothetical protein
VTTVNQLQGAQALEQTQRGGGMRAHIQKILQPVADKLGMSGDDLHTALGSGKSFAEIAQSKGVSRNDLVKTVSDAISKNRPPGAPAVDPNQLANRMVDDLRGAHRGYHSHAPSGSTSVQDPDCDGDTHGVGGASGTSSDSAFVAGGALQINTLA